MVWLWRLRPGPGWTPEHSGLHARTLLTTGPLRATRMGPWARCGAWERFPWSRWLPPPRTRVPRPSSRRPLACLFNELNNELFICLWGVWGPLPGAGPPSRASGLFSLTCGFCLPLPLALSLACAPLVAMLSPGTQNSDPWEPCDMVPQAHLSRGRGSRERTR